MNIDHKKPENRPLYIFALIAVGVILFLNIFAIPAMQERSVEKTDYSTFLSNVERGNVSKAEVQDDYIYYVVRKNGEDVVCKTVRMDDPDLVSRLYEAGTSMEAVEPQKQSIFLSLVIGYVIPIVIFVFLGRWLSKKMMSSMGGGPGGAMSFGKSNAKVYVKSSTGIKFTDVAGEDEAKELLTEIVDYLHNPQKYTEIGASMPKGALLVGPPGTGKTLLAKAVAGEAEVPFFSISGSEFVEMFVGMGAAKVRDLFKQANEKAPCIVFIDEIDTIGKKRDSGSFTGGNDEREQTLNQLLVEMDGMTDNNGIVIIAATNRPDVLDPALLRSGRFDRRVTVNLPDIKGREEILQVHARNKKLASDVSLENLARRTPGFSGADLANVLNEGAILAVRNKETQITMNDLDEAIDRVMMGPAKKSKKYTEKDKLLVAYHEAGHAVIGLKLEDADMVQKVTIIPRGEAGGYNLMTPREEKYFHRKSEFLAKITGLLGGRTSEELVFGEISAGAVNDIEQLTKIAKNMVRVYGMSSLGPIQYADPQGNVFLGRDYTQGGNYSNGVAAEIDKEVRKIIDECHENCRKILEENRDLLDLIAKSLVERETLTNEEITNLMNYGQITNPNEPVEVQEPKETEVKEPVETEVPPKPPVGVEKQDLDDALNELTKKKD